MALLDAGADTPRTVLFVGHDAFRAGAQIEMLHLLRWLHDHSDLRIRTLLKRGGELVPDYRAVVPTEVLYADTPGVSSPIRSLYGRLLATWRRHATLQTVSRLKVDLLYFNSVASLDVLPQLVTRQECPVICHVHELEPTIRRVLGFEAFTSLQKYVDVFIAVSDAVKHNLQRVHQIQDPRLERIYGAIPTRGSTPVRNRDHRVLTRHDLGLPADAIIVGASGTLDWRKGPDLYLQVAGRLSRTRPELPLHFVWVGGQTSGRYFDALQYDAERLGISSRVHFVGPRANPEAFFALFDLFLLTSREGPFPLVCLEAAAMSIPIVCFLDAGGLPEFVGDDAGIAVPYLDVEAAASAVATLAASADLRQQLGQCAAGRVKAAHDIGAAGNRILGVINRLTRQRPA